MGIQHLNKYIKKMVTRDTICKITFQDLSNKILAIDTSIYLYKFTSENALFENMYLLISIFKYELF